MRAKVTVSEDSRKDGLGRDIKGWFIHDHGMVLGPAYASRDEAMNGARAYVKDLYGCISGWDGK